TTSIAINAVPLAVQAITPASNSTNVIVTTPITVNFNKPIVPATLTGSSFRVMTATGNPVIGAITVLAGNRVASFTPANALAGSASYRVALSTAVLDIYGNPLNAAFEATFATAAV